MPSAGANPESVTAEASPAGRTYAPVLYAVGREKIREFALATGETNPLHLDLDAARAAGHADLVAPPMFAVVYQGRCMDDPLDDPDLAIDYPRLLHVGQEFRWGPLVIAGDEITTTVTVANVSERAGLRFYDFRAESRNQRGELVADGLWRNVVREREGGSE
ncbi:MAG TPA: MaoC family dehydratase N-terminal domain-containing protein [Solirubrobacteraceae bacterium]|nr:MaoC family dehydratase N-terminal domain-containing protein [Solirubrobacteraceae bacterium]